MHIMFSSLLLLVSAIFDVSIATYRNYGDCPVDLADGSKCFGRPWQHDGVCLYTTQSKKNECISPNRQVYLFEIEAKLSESMKRMYLRGSGPGLSWEKSIEMKKTRPSIWTVDIQYTSDFNSLLCKHSSHCSLNQGAMEFRLYKDDQGREEMQGPNFYVSLPLSNSLAGSKYFKKPKVTVYPWFEKGASLVSGKVNYAVVNDILKSTLLVEGKLIYPASFKKNIYKRYPLIIVLEKTYSHRPLLNYLFSYMRSVEEAIFLFIQPESFLYHTSYTILPFDSYSMECKYSKEQCLKCHSCWNRRRTEPCDKEEFIVKSKKCLNLKRKEGIGEAFITDIIRGMAAQIKKQTRDRIMFDPPKNRVTLVGYGESAVTAFIMGLTRPDLVANVAALSPKFFLPLRADYKCESRILKRMENLALTSIDNNFQHAFYASQKYFISQGENDDHYFPLANSIQVTEKVIKKLQDNFTMKEGENFMFQVMPGESLQYPNEQTFRLISHLQNLMMFFHKTQGGPNKNHARVIDLEEEFFAERQPAPDDATTVDQDMELVPAVDNDVGETAGLDCPTRQRQFPITTLMGSISKLICAHTSQLYIYTK